MNLDYTFPMAQAVQNAHREGLEDEKLLPLVLTNQLNQPSGRIQPGNSLIIYNISTAKEIELIRSLTESNLGKFPVRTRLNLNFATMIKYTKEINALVAYPPEEKIIDTLIDIISARGLGKAKITEAEKAVPASSFFNGKKYYRHSGEELIIIPTCKDVAVFDEAPEMSIEEISAAAGRWTDKNTGTKLKKTYQMLIYGEGKMIKARERQ